MVDVGGSNNDSLADLNSRANLTRLLDELGERPEQEAEIRGRIEEIFSQHRAILILDMSGRSEEHTSELQSLMRISYAVFCLKKKKESINKNVRNTTEYR